jgi:membrane fusion protein, multidrug efflux system
VKARFTAPAALAVAALLAACSRPAPEPEPLRSVRTVTVESSAAGLRREFAAEVRARSETRLAFRVGGKLVERPVQLGQVVRAGEVVGRLDPEDLRQAQDAARAGLAAAQANLDVNTADFARFTQLREQGFISQAELDRRRLALQSAQAQADQARAQAQVQRNQAAYSVLVAPQAGVITAVEAEPGQVLGAGTPVVRLAVEGPRDAVFAVPEDSRGLLAGLLGKPGALKVRNFDGSLELAATLRELAASADPVTRTFQARADLGAARPPLGQSASVLLKIDGVAQTMRLPLAAVFRAGQGSAVWVVEPGAMTVRQQLVQVLGAEGSEVLLAGGLKAGDRVVSAGAHTLTAGQKVRWYQPAAEAAAASLAASAPLLVAPPAPQR